MKNLVEKRVRRFCMPAANTLTPITSAAGPKGSWIFYMFWGHQWTIQKKLFKNFDQRPALTTTCRLTAISAGNCASGTLSLKDCAPTAHNTIFLKTSRYVCSQPRSMVRSIWLNSVPLRSFDRLKYQLYGLRGRKSTSHRNSSFSSFRGIFGAHSKPVLN